LLVLATCQKDPESPYSTDKIEFGQTTLKTIPLVGSLSITEITTNSAKCDGIILAGILLIKIIVSVFVA